MSTEREALTLPEPDFYLDGGATACFYESSIRAALAQPAVPPKAIGQDSRILLELAGSASLCWEPKPTGVFDSSLAIRFVKSALAELRASVAQPAVPEPPRALPLHMQMQQMCSDWGAYWCASDAHGVDLTHEQALELLRFALGVEVEIAAAQGAAE